CVLSCELNIITEDMLSSHISRLPAHFMTLKEIELASRTKYIQNVLSFTGGNVSHAANILKIDRRTIQRLRKHSSQK
ncbi:MAG: hypothetical protein E3J78_04715, partial [Candidatus Cloacimonadota bacterium]